jgi:hypothetical protein
MRDGPILASNQIGIVDVRRLLWLLLVDRPKLVVVVVGRRRTPCAQLVRFYSRVFTFYRCFQAW